MGLLYQEVVNLATFIQNHQCKSVCMIGKQYIAMEAEYFKKLSRMFGIQVDETLNTMDSYDFFRLIGVENVSALDYSAYEGADIVFDLNADTLPNQYREKFDLVIDGGTLEHVFNQYNALNNINALVAEGGYVYHMLPCAGWVDHGFYSFSPTYFEDVYAIENGWKLDSLCLFTRFNDSISRSQDCRLFHDYVELNQYILKNVTVDGIMIECFAKKVKSLQNKICPIQGIYVQTHSDVCMETSRLYKEVLQNIDNIAGNIKKEAKITIYGCGDVCNLFLNALHKNGLESLVDMIFDSDVSRAGTSFRGIPIKYPSKVNLQNCENKILITSTKYQFEIMELLLENGVKEDRILTFASLI